MTTPVEHKRKRKKSRKKKRKCPRPRKCTIIRAIFG